jgi:hypothetical protein
MTVLMGEMQAQLSCAYPVSKMRGETSSASGVWRRVANGQEGGVREDRSCFRVKVTPTEKGHHGGTNQLKGNGERKRLEGRFAPSASDPSGGVKEDESCF